MTTIELSKLEDTIYDHGYSSSDLYELVSWYTEAEVFDDLEATDDIAEHNGLLEQAKKKAWSINNTEGMPDQLKFLCEKHECDERFILDWLSINVDKVHGANP